MTITANYLAWKDDQSGYEAALNPDQGVSDNTAKEMICLLYTSDAADED